MDVGPLKVITGRNLTIWLPICWITYVRKCFHLANWKKMELKMEQNIKAPPACNPYNWWKHIYAYHHYKLTKCLGKYNQPWYRLKNICCVICDIQVGFEDTRQLREVNTVATDGRIAWEPVLTHWGPVKMATIFQTTFSNAFSWMKIYQFR